MSVINILSPHLADMIAAGEVVERPASVIKELVENSLDAGATNITVEIRNGGASLIRVADDGCGMSPEDAGIAFLRHATSKLSDEHGLEGIATMGFRGEALAAISAVSEIELLTKRREAETGTAVRLLAGEIQDMEAVGCPDGTDIRVSKLFYNTPARQKFMKSDRSEAAACQQVVLRCALSRPDVSFRFIRDGETQLLCPSGGGSKDRIYSALGREAALDMLPCLGDNQGLKIEGFVSSPSACRGNRSSQYFFCNGRYIRSQLIQAALEQAYRNSLLTGRYPGCVLYLSIPYGSVDVNVHPAKTEVKFSNEKLIYDLVYYSTLSALSPKKSAPAVASPSTAPKNYIDPPAQGEDTALSGPAHTVASPVASGSLESASQASAPVTSSGQIFSPSVNYSPSSERSEAARGMTGSSSALPVSPSLRSSPAVRPVSVFAEDWDPEPPVKQSAPVGQQLSIPVSAAEENVEKAVESVEKSVSPAHKIIGELFKKYIVVEVSDSVLLIDKHAAHERMIFDSLKLRGYKTMSQSLLVPLPMHLSAVDSDIISAHTGLLMDFGFELDPLDSGDYLIRAVPSDISAGDAVSTIEDICEQLRLGASPDPDSAKDTVLHTVACKAAIKAGWDNDSLELERLVDAVLAGKVLYCPHGRPVSFTVDSKELDKRFKRIV